MFLWTCIHIIQHFKGCLTEIFTFSVSYKFWQKGKYELHAEKVARNKSIAIHVQFQKKSHVTVQKTLLTTKKNTKRILKNLLFMPVFCSLRMTRGSHHPSIDGLIFNPSKTWYRIQTVVLCLVRFENYMLSVAMNNEMYVTSVTAHSVDAASCRTKSSYATTAKLFL
jgi:hypothetical protein